MKAFQEPTGTRSGTAMDPQQRLMLEVAYESFSNAGITMDSLWGSNTGVYVGQWTSDYHEIATRDVQKPPLYLVTGTGPAISSNRISYIFNLRGPSFTMDTGCSSSLVALHQAVLSLRNGETTQCFVGGVNLLLDPQRFHYQSQLKMFSKEGRSYPFDARANGYGRGEGVTGVVLKPLSVALRDGDPIRAVIRNSVLNQDGRTQGISVPSAIAQKEAIIRAYRQAKLEMYADYVEAHGTGTKVGDPIEASAIAAALTHRRSPSRPLPIGSIKGNIGHTESAAGLAGLIKSVLMLEHGIIPPQVNHQTVNPDIPLDEWNLRIPVKLERQTLRRISLNSFGYATDAIAGFGRPSLSNHMQLTYHSEKPRVFMRICARLAKYLIQNHRNSINPDALLARLAHNLSKQSVHAFRVVFVTSNVDDLINQLNKMGQPRIALVFSGQGAQYAEMGRDLLKSYPSFVRSLENARQQLARLGCPWDLLSELCRPKADSRVNEPAFSQPLCTAIQLALVDLLQEFGVSPSAVLGHSSGEIGAAYAAGAVSFKDAITIAYYRGKLASELVAANQSPGAMVAVGASPSVAEEHIAKVGPDCGRMRVACFNSPSSVTVSGDVAAIDRLKEILDGEGVFNRKLMTHGAAYHSHQMELMADKYTAALKGLQARPIHSSVRMFSSVTSQELDEKTVLDGAYWVRNLTSPVLFSQGLNALCEQEYNGLPIDTIVEVGPHSQLAGPVNQILKTISGPHGQVSYANTLKRGDDAETALLRCLGFLVIKNGSVRLNELNKDSKEGKIQALVDLPPYAFDHDRDYRQREHLPHELLGSLSTDVNRLEPRWRRFLSLKESPWLRNHIVQGLITFPAAGYITMAVQATRQHIAATNPASKIQYIRLRDVSFGKGLVLSDENPEVEISLSLRPQARTSRESSSVWNEFRIFTVSPDQKWTEHCRGLVQAEIDSVEGFKTVFTPADISRVDAECIHEVTPQKFYAVGKCNGLDWQHPFNNMHKIRSGKDSCVATARVPEAEMSPGGMDDLLHPAVLDSALFHGLSTVIFIEEGHSSAYVPTFIKQLWIANRQSTPGTDLVCTTTRRNEPFVFDLHTKDAASKEGMALVAQGIRVTNLGGNVAAGTSKKEACHSQTLHRDQVCNAIAALAVNFVQNALREVSSDAWMETLRNETFDESLLINEGKDLGVIAEILTGKTSALSLLNTNNLLSRVYTEWVSSRVLEIGAALNGGKDRFAQRYDFTDISPGFLEPAKQRLGDLADVVEFQGFEESSYDLIVACNTLRNIRPLLKPGGRFMLMEITQYNVFTNMIFGLFEGCVSEWCGRLEEDGGHLGVFISSAPNPRSSEESFPIYLLTDPAVATADEQVQLVQEACEGSQVSLRAINSPCQAGIVVMLPELARLLCASPTEDANAVLFVSNNKKAELSDAETGLWTGFARTMRLEYPNLQRLGEVLPTLLSSPSLDLGRPGSELFVSRYVRQAAPELVPFLGVPGPALGPDDDVLIAAGHGVVVEPGDRVCALYSRSYTNYPIVHGDCCQVIPDSLSFAEGASLPIVWATVYYGLLLIHSAAGAVGQASIMLAQHLGAEVFATVGSDAKRDLLHTNRTTAFHGGIMEYTGGGEMFRESCNLLASFGRFVEIGRKDLMDDALMPMEYLLRNITFAYPLARRLLRDVAALAEAGSIKPSAFRLIQAGKHTGKIILTVDENQEVKAVPSMPAQAQLRDDASYIIVGGLGGLGRSITVWLAEHGAKHIVALSRSGAKDADSRAFVEDIRSRGVNLIAPPCDVASKEAVADMVQGLERFGLPRVRGIINSAMVLRDTLFDSMTADDWRTSLASKVRGSQNLHAAFQSDSLDFFIMMSSIVTVRGNFGQSNYSAACSFQDTFVRHMANAGEPGFSINIGPIRDVGYVAENPEVAEALRRNGLGSISVSDVLVLLNYAVNHARDADPTSCVASIGLVPSDDEAENGRDFLLSDRRYAQLVKYEGAAAKNNSESADAVTLLASAPTVDDAVAIVTEAILAQLSKLIATPVEMLSPAQSLDSYGVDSLVAVELRNWIGAYLQANVQLMVIRGAASISQLAQVVTKESRVVKL
ncbi:type I polyketide synthase [Aspergillus undulatus]|uniref:type I polyketide synthase n=1 Tax=Aspergillus undulatus TaxID=1810928 RepID=UPI003CCE50AE